MGVPLLLTWLRNNFGQCITYIAPRHTQWGRKRNTAHAQSNAILSSATSANAHGGGPGGMHQQPHGMRPRIVIPNAKRTTAASTVDNLYIDLNSLLYQSVTMVVDKGVRDAEAAGHRAAHIVTALTPGAAGSTSAAKPSSATSSIGYETETKILAQLVVLLDELIMMTNPTSLIYIAVDGVSPKGKMSQQRTRRSNTVKKGFHAKIKSLLGWDSNAITSGTLFMQRVTQVLHYYAVSRVERANGHSGVSVLGPNGSFADATMESDTILDIAMDRCDKAAIFRDRHPAAVLPPGVTFVINDVRIAGEGEHKIIDAIRSFRDVKAVLEVGGGNRTNSESAGATAAKSASSGNAMNLEGVHVITPKQSPRLGAADPNADTTVPPYAVFQYNPNTTHCIVSPDTDVVVCSLSLHEPHMTVFWYNAQDPEDSQYFSLLEFREILKGKLGFNGDANDKERAQFFEESLHDVIFILLLFGNDFLPKASALTDIGEGQLDNLLDFFVTDFVSRKRHIVDARTGRIDFAAARYIIDFAVNAERQKKVYSGAEGERKPRDYHGGGGGGNHGGGGGHGGNAHGGGGNPYNKGPYGTKPQINFHGGASAAAPAAGGSDTPFNPFAQGNDVVPGTTGKAGQPQLTEEEIASRCYDYWGGLQWAMLYCTGPCPSWSWQYFHTTVPSAENLSKYCGMRDDLFDSCFVSTLTLSPSRRANAPTSGAAEQYYVGRSDLAMDVVMQLVLLMPFGSRELLPVSIIDAYTKDLAPRITDRPFEEIDLLFVMEWCEKQKAKLAAVDAQRLASFNTDRNPTIVRYTWPGQGIVTRIQEATDAATGVGTAVVGGADSTPMDPFGLDPPADGDAIAPANPFGTGLIGGFGDITSAFGDSANAVDGDDDDLFAGFGATAAPKAASNPSAAGPAAAAAAADNAVPPSPAINPTAHGAAILHSAHTPSRTAPGNEWVRLAGPYSVPYPKSQMLLKTLQNQHQQYHGDTLEAFGSPNAPFIQQLGGVAPIFVGLVTFFFDFKEDLNVPGMNTVTKVYRCGDASSEKTCAPMVSLQWDWSRHRPLLVVGECREAASAADDASAALLSMTSTNTIHNANSATSGYLFRRTFLLPGVVQVPRGHAARKRQREEGESRPTTPQPASSPVEQQTAAVQPQAPPPTAVVTAPTSEQPAPAATGIAAALEERRRQLAARLANKVQTQ